MKVLPLFVITMVLMTIHVQSGLIDTVTGLLSELGLNVGQVAKGLEAETICECAEKFYMDGNFTSCESDQVFNIRQFAQDITKLIPRCTNLTIPFLEQVANFVPSGLKLQINGKEQCKCANDHYLKGQFKSCKGTGLYNPLKVVEEMGTNFGCKTNGQGETQTNGQGDTEPNGLNE